MGGGLALAAVGLGDAPRPQRRRRPAASLVIAVAVGDLRLASSGVHADDRAHRRQRSAGAGRAASGISETSAELGGALGIAILGSLGTVVYRSRVAESLPYDLPADVADAVRDTLGGALAIAQTLPGLHGDAVVAAVKTAFVDALHLVAGVSAVLAVETAIVSAVALRTVPVRSESPRGGVRSGDCPSQPLTAAMASISTRQSGRASPRTKTPLIAVGRSPQTARVAANPSFRSTPSTR